MPEWADHVEMQRKREDPILQDRLEANKAGKKNCVRK